MGSNLVSDDTLLSFIAANLKYPVVAQENGIQGRVIVKFVVDKDGRITDVEITRSVLCVSFYAPFLIVRMANIG